jgi:hypothetical protein
MAFQILDSRPKKILNFFVAGPVSTKYFPQVCRQGDQIGRIFAQRATVYFGQFLENYKSSPHLCATFSLSISMY